MKQCTCLNAGSPKRPKIQNLLIMQSNFFCCCIFYLKLACWSKGCRLTLREEATSLDLRIAHLRSLNTAVEREHGRSGSKKICYMNSNRSLNKNLFELDESIILTQPHSPGSDFNVWYCNTSKQLSSEFLILGPYPRNKTGKASLQETLSVCVRPFPVSAHHCLCAQSQLHDEVVFSVWSEKRDRSESWPQPLLKPLVTLPHGNLRLITSLLWL